MAESKSLAVENHHNSCNLGSLLLHDQLEQGEDSSEEVKERNLGEIGEKLIAANLLGRPLAKPEHNHSPPLSVPHLWTEDQISFPDMLQSRRRSGAHVRIIVLDHPMRARDQFGTNVYVPIATAQKSERD